MTYKQLSKQIEKIDEQIKFVKELQEATPNGSQDVRFGGIIDSLLGYKNYLKFEKL